MILFCIFYNINKGFYIDIGANDPNYISVTKAFYLNGWNGINIEPQPEKYLSLLKSRSKDINLQIGVGEKKGNETLYLFGAGSTLFKKFLKKPNKIINIKIDTMLNVCKDYIKKNIKIQFCKIDVEGNEKNVLLGYDFNNCRAEVFMIESTIPGTAIPYYSHWEKILLENDYSFVYQYSINRFYVDNRIPNLKKKFEHIDEYLNYFMFCIFFGLNNFNIFYYYLKKYFQLSNIINFKDLFEVIFTIII